MQSATPNEIFLRADDFWIVFRQRFYGPFDYQWSVDLYGMEFRFQGQKFGEFCSDDEFFADLSPYQLPPEVCSVVMLVAAHIVQGVRSASSPDDRLRSLESLLTLHQHETFRVHSDAA
ncbi:MAG: hypothetical protein JNL58_11610 [Planctomyces sp.]|nr:hypothetical protein [Planctomyces sp.]